MDSLTHIVLGAIVGEALAGKRLGKKAMLVGALAQSIPDIDFLASLWLPADENLLTHRGFTHSIFFTVLIVPLLAWISNRRVPSLSIKKWILFFGLQIFIHLSLDTCNAYGVGWLEPFNHSRPSFNILFVVDPFFSIPLGIFTAVLFFLHRNTPGRIRWAIFSLIVSILYVSYAISNKIKIEHQVNEGLQQQHISSQRHFITPSPFNSFLWYVAAEDKNGYYISYRSVFDRQNLIKFAFFPRNDSLLTSIHQSKELKNLLTFSQGWYTINKKKDTLLFNDLRFGQISGWSNPKGDFVFHYYLNRPDENRLVMQRGRLTAWNYKSVKLFLRRIRGE